MEKYRREVGEENHKNCQKTRSLGPTLQGGIARLALWHNWAQNNA